MSTEDPAPPRPGLRDAVAALKQRDFALFWWGALVSNTGMWVQRAAVPFVLFELTGSATWVGFSAFAALVPAVAMNPLAGALADRYPRRTVLLLTQSGAALLALALWVVFLVGAESPSVIVALVAASGLVLGLNIPSWQAFVADLVPRDKLLNAVTLNSTQFNASRAVGPAIAGVILAAWGPAATFLVNALSFVAVIGALLAIRVERPAEQPPRESIVSGFGRTVRYLRARPGMAVCIKVVVLLGLLGQPVFQLVKVFTDEVFEVGPVAFGLMASSLGIGSVIGAPLIAGPGSGQPRGRLTFVGVMIYSTALTVFALAPTYEVGLVALFVAGAAYLAVASSLNTTLQMKVEETMRGRVMAMYLLSFTAAIPVGSLLQGWLADVIGVRITVAAAGVIFAAGALWLGPVRGLIARMDDDHAEPVEPPDVTTGVEPAAAS